jgi:hypothetical protein
MSMGRRRCHCRQHSKEGLEYPLADRAVAGSNVQEWGGHVNVLGQKELPLTATFKGRTYGPCLSKSVVCSQRKRALLLTVTTFLFDLQLISLWLAAVWLHRTEMVCVKEAYCHTHFKQPFVSIHHTTTPVLTWQ